MLSRAKPIANSEIYFIKKSKEPDHLLNMLQKQRTR